ncbi:MAG: hypothetical protein QXS54_12925, partial [Candidatus Methanomethylicaceae archaeon]
EKQYVTCQYIGSLRDRVESISAGVTLRQFLQWLRYRYLTEHCDDRAKRVMERAGISVPDKPSIDSNTEKRFNEIAREVGGDWGDSKFHIRHRIHLNRSSSNADFDFVCDMLPELGARRRDLEDIVQGNRPATYDLSILPLNFVIGNEVINYFVPPDDYFSPHVAKVEDPYGLIQGRSRARGFEGQPAVVVDGIQVLGTHKFSHTFLLNLDFYCPVGCSDCYKTRMGTRELWTAKEPPPVFSHSELGALAPPSRQDIPKLVESVVQWMNNSDRGKQVYDVILSGGEPLLLDTDEKHSTIGQVLDILRRADNLRILRICTGTLFLGMPFRINKALLDMLQTFSLETGVRVTIQAHLGNHHMISPEAVMTVQKIREVGIPIYSQIPIKNGINFFLDDLQKTMDFLVQLGRKQVVVGVEPYMFIVDMHPSTIHYYVPIEPLMQVWGALVESHDYPGLERPRTLSVLFAGGNIILSGHTLFSARKKVDPQNRIVTYHIPRIGPSKKWKAGINEYFVYNEPLLEGINDDPDSLEGIARRWSEIASVTEGTLNVR